VSDVPDLAEEAGADARPPRIRRRRPVPAIVSEGHSKLYPNGVDGGNAVFERGCVARVAATRVRRYVRNRRSRGVIMTIAIRDPSGSLAHAVPAGGDGAGSSPASGRLVLTSRGRRVRALLLLVLLVTLVVSVVGLASQARAGSADEPLEVVRVQVQPGDTLWDIAREQAPGHDVVDAVTRIREANRLDDAMLQPGMRLVIPASLRQG
jgi:nucleoid-associated protein YgaU